VETAAELGAFAFHRGTVKAVAVRPGSGGDVFASCGRDGALALWDARVASRASASVAPYGERLSLAASSKPVAVVERAHEDDHGSSRGAAKTKTKTKTKARVASVSSAAFAHDGQVLLSAGAADGLVKLWDARRLHRKTPVAAMADADPGASAGGLGRTEDLWGDATTPRRPRRGITSLALAPNGSTRVAASYSDSHIAVFDHNAPSAGPACHLRAPGRRSTFKTSFYVKTAFSPCGTHLASGSCDTAVYVWNADRPLASPAALAGHAGEVSAVDWSPAEFGRIASCADDGTARVWAVDRGFAALKGGRTDDDEDDDRRSDEDEVRVEKTRRLADATPARDASSPAGTSAPTSLRTPALFSRERSIQAYFSPRDSQW
jgi:denticleless